MAKKKKEKFKLCNFLLKSCLRIEWGRAQMGMNCSYMFNNLTLILLKVCNFDTLIQKNSTIIY
jgi:hypothetical protein